MLICLICLIVVFLTTPFITLLESKGDENQSQPMDVEDNIASSAAGSSGAGSCKSSDNPFTDSGKPS